MKTDSQQWRSCDDVRPLRSAHPLGSGVATVVMVIAAILTGSVQAQLRVVVSIEPYREPVERLLGDEGQVEVLLPPGASPHGFEPTPRAVARLADADLVVVNGRLDDWILDLLDAAEGDVARFVALEALSPGQLLAGEPVDRGSDGTRRPNPHVWLDPRRMAVIVVALADRVAELRPDLADVVAARRDAYLAELQATDAEVAELLAPLAGAPFVPFHDAWPYFAQRYGLDLLLEIEPFPGREPSARQLTEAVQAIRAAGAVAIFTEVQLADRPARVLADEAGVALGLLDPVGGVEGRNGYLQLLLYNARTIAAALTPPSGAP